MLEQAGLHIGNVKAPSTAVGRDASAQRIAGLDSIRFTCAFVVLLDHLGLLPDAIHGRTLPLVERVLAGVFNSLFNGPAAVIVFFVISGLCIHFPYRDRRTPDLASFYARRFFRIVPPAIILYVCLRLCGEKHLPQETILWSVICEAIYYLLYPALFWFRRRFGMLTLLAITAIISFGLIFTHSRDLALAHNSYGALGNETWIVGLPCWVLGCWLAENYQRLAIPSTTQIWLARVGIFVLSVGLRLMKFHVNGVWGSNCVTLNLFAIPACIWVGLEMRYFSRRSPMRVLEWAGGWSIRFTLRTRSCRRWWWCWDTPICLKQRVPIGSFCCCHFPRATGSSWRSSGRVICWL
jgi:peptidoglycan/LPS O-acetylase OafA/YrhL